MGFNVWEKRQTWPSLPVARDLSLADLLADSRVQHVSKLSRNGNGGAKFGMAVESRVHRHSWERNWAQGEALKDGYEQDQDEMDMQFIV